MESNGINIVKLGMEVVYRGSFGSGAKANAKIEDIELCDNEHEKYGIPVEEVHFKDLRRCVVNLSDGHWAYGYQIDEVVG